MILSITLFLFAKIIFAQNLATLTLLKDAAAKDGAVCLDGSPAAYYFRKGTGDGVNKWFLHHQGGGFCTSLADCYSRSLSTLGSSKTYPTNYDLGGGYFSTDARVNPLMYNWNMVFFPYCDGGFFLGNNANVSQYQGHNLYFRGYRNELAYMQDLTQNHDLMKGTDFVIGGCSAGGLATFYHVDRWREYLPKSGKVRGLPDSGFVLNYSGGQGPAFAAYMQWIFNAMNVTSGLNQACVAAHEPTKDISQCIFIENTTPYISTPIFPLQSEYDAWQVENILVSKDVTAINAYGSLLESRFKAAVFKSPNSQNGCFFDSCYHHCGEWDSIVIDNTNSGVAFKSWYDGAKGVYFQDKVYPCTSCC